MSLLSIPEAAARLGISRYRVWQLVQAGRIPGAQLVGRSWVIPEKSLAAVADRPNGRPAKDLH